MGAPWVEGQGRGHMRHFDPELVDGLDYFIKKWVAMAIVLVEGYRVIYQIKGQLLLFPLVYKSYLCIVLLSSRK